MATEDAHSDQKLQEEAFSNTVVKNWERFLSRSGKKLRKQPLVESLLLLSSTKGEAKHIGTQLSASRAEILPLLPDVGHADLISMTEDPKFTKKKLNFTFSELVIYLLRAEMT